MARRKISIEDALRVLEEAGIPLQPKPVEAQPQLQPQPKASPAFAKSTSQGTVRIELFAKHSVGSGGSLKAVDGEKQVESAGVQSYGPGVCHVPPALASHLLYADAVARQADERFLSREQKCYLVVPRGSSGSVNVALEVQSDLFDNGLGSIPQEYTYRVR